METKKRTYAVGKNPVNGRDLLTVHAHVGDLPFNVWRDVGRLARMSYDNLDGHVVYEFLEEGKIKEAESVLRGALFQKV